MTKQQQFLADRWDKNGKYAPRWMNVPAGQKPPKHAMTREVGAPQPATDPFFLPKAHSPRRDLNDHPRLRRQSCVSLLLARLFTFGTNREGGEQR